MTASRDHRGVGRKAQYVRRTLSKVESRLKDSPPEETQLEKQWDSTEFPLILTPLILPFQDTLQASGPRVHFTIAMPLWFQDQRVVEASSGPRSTDNFYVIESPTDVQQRARALLFDPRWGFSDVWASLVNIPLCSITCNESSAPLIGDVFNLYINAFVSSNKGRIAPTPLSVALNKVQRFSTGSAFDRHEKPVYGADWLLSGPESIPAWHRVIDIVRGFSRLLYHFLHYIGMKSDQFRLVEFLKPSRRRGVIIRKYNPEPDRSVLETIHQLNRSEINVQGLQGTAIELQLTGAGYESHPIHRVKARRLLKDSDGKPCLFNFVNKL